MALPPSPLIEAREALQWLREQNGCTGAEADTHLQDLIDAYPKLIKWLGEEPSHFPAAEDLDFFSGRYVRTSGPLPRYSTLDYGPQEYGYSRSEYRFKIWRPLLEEVCGIARAPSPPGREPPAPVGDIAAPLQSDKHRRDGQGEEVENAVREQLARDPHLSDDALFQQLREKNFTREQVRAAATNIRGTRPRGRPQNSPEKFAEK